LKTSQKIQVPCIVSSPEQPFYPVGCTGRF